MSRVDRSKNVEPKKLASPPVKTVFDILEQLWRQGTDSAKIVFE